VHFGLPLKLAEYRRPAGDDPSATPGEPAGDPPRP
jgi:hypothetical protein